ncbi:ABC transporter permease [Prescottella agglutinans]|uniref:Osmoprotectant transport system permease protein n=1 Tax=Prescottella agglutinans TaxID=1644129 RepID=A0ABT6MI17_9NOCA|nr:ABC transporter permease [Prescottella agglutinans]MDH6282969.1 osmoprotectant transport system permease protein [Prescottella agglutinans]
MRWLIDNFPRVLELTREHLQLALLPLLLGLAIAVPLGTAVRRVGWLRRTTVVAASIAFTIPSLALFVTVPSLFGLSVLDPANVVIALTVYSTALLVRVVPEALDAVPDDVVDASTAMGFPPVRRALTVELPLALPVLIANVRVVAVTNISLVSVGALIGVGGLGELFTEGYQRDYPDQIVAGIIAIVALALAFDAALYVAGRLLTPWERPGRRTRRTTVELSEGPA